ncbi:hypothetical protein [Ruminococcus sp.]|uniref:hypothetical protein n=1 Tax=Ruminococcus sp. TaxID=41978 RepID=UPI0025F3395D|nr:hypothetical protein [Ruminococcus sp.]MBQ8966961.1 hypothetical protein [Ruminococcus sp.]
MKRAISIITAAVIILSLSACKNNEASKSDWRIVSSNNLVEPEKNGMFITNTYSSLSFLDFSTMEQAPVCDDPTCMHQVDSGCTSYGKENHPFLYGDKLYYLKRSDIYQDKDIYINDTQLWQSDINGANEKLVTEFKKLDYSSYNNMVLYGDTIYMCMEYKPFDKDYNELEHAEKFVTYNLKSGKTKNYGDIVKGYVCSSDIIGVWDNKVIFRISNSKENLPYMELVEKYAKDNGVPQSEAMTAVVNEYDTIYWQFDISEKSISESMLSSPMAISKNCYYYSEEDKITYLDKDGNENIINGIIDINDAQIHDGYVYFCNHDEDNPSAYLFNEQSKEVTTLDNNYVISAISNDTVILQIIDDKNGTLSYEKKAISEIEK